MPFWIVSTFGQRRLTSDFCVVNRRLTGQSLRHHRYTMSGGKFPYPKHVWTPTGGWWFTPKNYKSNVMIIGSTAAVFAFGIFKLTQTIQYNPQKEYEESVVDGWNTAAAKGLK